MKTSQTENQKPKYKWAEIVHFKLAIIKWIILLALIALVATLWYIQSEYSDEYNQKILSQQRYDSREIPARRGDITDRIRQEVNARMPKFSRLSKVMVEKEPFQKTPKLTIKRFLYG